MSGSDPPLLVIVGPTAVGKTEIAIQIAEKFNGEIVSADSRLFYKFMDIGTDKPTIEQQNRIPHHLIDIAMPDQVCSLANYQMMAKYAIADINQRSKLPLLVGGTGQYIKAITEGWDIPAVVPNLELRSSLERLADKEGKSNLYALLKSLDPEAAERIDHRNLRRIIRAVEVIFSTGEKFSDQRRSKHPGYKLLIIGLNRPRKELYERIDTRIAHMIANGFIEEVKCLIDKGYSFGLPSLSAIGYREIKSFIDGNSSLPEAVIQIKRKSRQYVRRQANWFKPDDPDIHWYDLSVTDILQINDDIRSWLEEYIKQ